MWLRAFRFSCNFRFFWLGRVIFNNDDIRENRVIRPPMGGVGGWVTETWWISGTSANIFCSVLRVTCAFCEKSLILGVQTPVAIAVFV